MDEDDRKDNRRGTLAVSIVLTIFMGGLGLGSYIAGRTIDRILERGITLARQGRHQEALTALKNAIIR